MQSPKVKAIAPWFGSNRKLSSNVGRLMGKRKWIGVPFVGGMCELLHLSASSIVANDLHRHVINLARVMADPVLGPTLYRKLRRYVLHPDHLDACQQRCEIRERQIDTSAPMGPPDLWWAEDYFICSWFGRNGSAGARDEFNNGFSVRWCSGGGDSAVRVRSAVGSIPAWRRALRGVTFSTVDALDFIDKSKDDDGSGIYCDPPFPGPGNRYRHKVDEAFQRRLATKVSSFNRSRVVMRFYEHPLITELYPEDVWAWHRFAGRTQTNKESAELLLVSNGATA